MMAQLPCACGKPIPCYASQPCTNLAFPTVGPLYGDAGILTVDKLIERLFLEGGAIVNANVCSAYELASARADGRVYVDTQGFGFVLRTREWLDNVHALEFLQP